MAFTKSALIVISATDYFNLWMWLCEGLCDGAKGKQKGKKGKKFSFRGSINEAIAKKKI
jgi:hypothetical protein